MQAGDHRVDDVVVDHQAAERDQRQPRRPRSAPAAGCPGMQICGIAEPGDERPGLLRIPAPVTTPCLLGPDRASDDREGPNRKGEGDDPVGQPVQRGSRRQRLHQPALRGVHLDDRGGAWADAHPLRMQRRLDPAQERDSQRWAAALPALFQQVQHRHNAGHHEGTGRGDRRDHVDLDPVRVQGRHERSGCGVQHGAGQPEVEHHRSHQEGAQIAHRLLRVPAHGLRARPPGQDRGGPSQRLAHQQEQEDPHRDQGDHAGELVHVSPRHPVDGESAGRH